MAGRAYAPKPDAVYKFKERDTTGFSTKYEVKGPADVEWSAKLGPEAQTEVLLSRILWGLGYHQQPIYYLPSWTLEHDGIKSTESEARFRPKLSEFERLDEYWWWQQNPFVGTRESNGLLVILLMFNSTDLKNDNNSIYKFKEPVEGADRWFVVRDLGAALGETGKMYPRRNCLECFEQHGFITAIDGDHVQFDYVGRHQELLSMIRPRGRAVGRGALAEADRHAVARRLPRRELLGERRESLHPEAQREDRRRPRAARPSRRSATR